MIEAVLFDIDGTLIDSVDLHARAWQDAFRRYGIETEFHAVRSQIGKGGDKLMQEFLSPDQIKRLGTAIEEERGEIFKRDYLPLVRPFPKVKELFTRLDEDGIKIAVASSAKEDELKNYKKILGIDRYLDHEISSDDVANSKPDPDIFLAARKKLGSNPRNTLAVGDTPYDAESAGRAGIATIGLLSGGWTAGQLRAAGCVAVYRDVDDLLRKYASSPFRFPARTDHPDVGEQFHGGKEKSVNSRDNFLYFLIGAGLGAALGVLYAPKSGADTRAFLQNKAEEGSDYVQDAVTTTAQSVRETLGRAKQVATDGLERGKKAVKDFKNSDTLATAVEVGKQAYREAQEGGFES